MLSVVRMDGTVSTSVATTRGKYLVIGLLAFLVLLVLLLVILRPGPITPLEAALVRQQQVFPADQQPSRELLETLSKEHLESYIDLLNYRIRIADSLAMFRATASAATASPSGNIERMLLDLSLRDRVTDLKVRALLNGELTLLVDSVYAIAHQIYETNGDEESARAARLGAFDSLQQPLSESLKLPSVGETQ